MIRKNIYSRITESIVNAYHDNNLDSAMDDGHEMENMGKKIVAIITADPDQDLDWESEYEPFGREELSDDDESECCEFEGIDHDTCPSCGSDVDGYIVSDDCEDCEDEDDDVVIGSGADSMEDVEIKDILVDILDELRGEGSESDDEDEDDADEDENPMFGSSSDDEEDESDDEDEEDADDMLAANDDWASDESDDEEDEDVEEDFEEIAEDDMDIEDVLAQP